MKLFISDNDSRIIKDSHIDYPYDAVKLSKESLDTFNCEIDGSHKVAANYAILISTRSPLSIKAVHRIKKLINNPMFTPLLGGEPMKKWLDGK